MNTKLIEALGQLHSQTDFADRWMLGYNKAIKDSIALVKKHDGEQRNCKDLGKPVNDNPFEESRKLISMMEDAQAKTANSKLRFGPPEEKPCDSCYNPKHNRDTGLCACNCSYDYDAWQPKPTAQYACSSEICKYPDNACNECSEYKPTAQNEPPSSNLGNINARINGLEKRLDGAFIDMGGINKRLQSLEGKIGNINARITSLSQDITHINKRLGDLESDKGYRLREMEKRIESVDDRLQQKVEAIAFVLQAIIDISKECFEKRAANPARVAELAERFKNELAKLEGGK